MNRRLTRLLLSEERTVTVELAGRVGPDYADLILETARIRG